MAMKGNLVLIKAEKIIANLCMLLGDMLQEVYALVATTSQEEAMMIWHQRLGHMSESKA